MSRRATQWLATAAALSCAMIVIAASTAEPAKPDEQDGVTPSRPKETLLAEAPSQPSQWLRPALTVPDRDPFSASAPPKPPKPARPAVPEQVATNENNQPVRPPALPFTFLGRVDLEEVQSAFVAEGNNMFVVNSGDVIDSRYLVERITETEIVFTHLPTQQRQSLPIW
jgi:hypothetical protein